MIISRSRLQNLMRPPQLTKHLGIGAAPEASRRGCAYRARLEAELSCAGVAPDLLTVLVPAKTQGNFAVRLRRVDGHRIGHVVTRQL